MSAKSQLTDAKGQLAALSKTADTSARHNARMREMCTCPITHEVTDDLTCILVVLLDRAHNNILAFLDVRRNGNVLLRACFRV